MCVCWVKTYCGVSNIHNTALAAASATASASSINSSSSAHAAFTGGFSNSKIYSRQGPSEVPSNSKINPQTPSRTKIENLIKYFNVWSQSGREHRYVYRWHSVWRPCPRDAVFLVWSCPGSNPEHALAQTPICLKSI